MMGNLLISFFRFYCANIPTIFSDAFYFCDFFQSLLIVFILFAHSPIALASIHVIFFEFQWVNAFNERRMHGSFGDKEEKKGTRDDDLGRHFLLLFLSNSGSMPPMNPLLLCYLMRAHFCPCSMFMFGAMLAYKSTT